MTMLKITFKSYGIDTLVEHVSPFFQSVLDALPKTYSGNNLYEINEGNFETEEDSWYTHIRCDLRDVYLYAPSKEVCFRLSKLIMTIHQRLSNKELETLWVTVNKMARIRRNYIQKNGITKVKDFIEFPYLDNQPADWK